MNTVNVRATTTQLFRLIIGSPAQPLQVIEFNANSFTLMTAQGLDFTVDGGAPMPIKWRVKSTVTRGLTVRTEPRADAPVAGPSLAAGQIVAQMGVSENNWLLHSAGGWSYLPFMERVE